MHSHMHSMNTADRQITQFKDILTRILEFLVTLAFTVILLLTISLVILRYGFNSSIIIGNELMEYLFIYTTALGAAVSLGKREHIKIDFFINKLRGWYRVIIDAVGQLLIAGINLVIFSLSFSWIRTVGYSESPVMRVPMRVVQIAVPIGCGLAALYALINIFSLFYEHGTEENGRNSEKTGDSVHPEEHTS